MRKQAADCILSFGTRVSEHRHARPRRNYNVAFQDGGTDGLDSGDESAGLNTGLTPDQILGAGTSGIGPVANPSTYGNELQIAQNTGYGTDLGGVAAPSVPNATTPGSSNIASLGSIFTGLGASVASIYKSTAGPQSVSPGVYYNPATGTYSTVGPAGVLTGNNSGVFILIAAAVVLLLVLK